MKRIGILLAACAAALGVRAQEPVLLSPDAKSMSMGGVVTTTLAASHAIYNNAAGAAFSPMKMQLSTTYFTQKEYNYYAASGSYNFDARNYLQAGWRLFRREKGNSDMMVDLGYARRIGERWSVGLVGRYTHLKRPGGNDDGLAADLSAMYLLPLENIGHYSTLRAGAKLAGLGGYFGDNGCGMPAEFTAGAAFDTFITDAHEITVAADLGYCFNPSSVRGFQASVGAEYNLMQLFQIRGGYHYGEKSACPSYASVGAGVRFLHLRLDFAYLFAEKGTYLRNTYSFSLGFDF